MCAPRDRLEDRSRAIIQSQALRGYLIAVPVTVAAESVLPGGGLEG